jgi:lysophospholipase L1-like esterase
MSVALSCGACSPVQPATTEYSPDAPARGTTAAAGPVQLVGLGDSVTAGTACGCQDFVALYAAGLARRWQHVVQETNLGRPGLTGAELLAHLQDDATERAQVGAADVVIVTIGANDLAPALKAWDRGSGRDERACGGTCDTGDLDRVGQDVDEVLEAISRLRGGRPTLVLVTTYWNVFEDGDVAAAERGARYLRWSDGLTQRLNARIGRAARAEGATLVDLYAPFKADGHGNPTSLLADDGDHPNAAGHRIIASALLAATPRSPASTTTS